MPMLYFTFIYIRNENRLTRKYRALELCLEHKLNKLVLTCLLFHRASCSSNSFVEFSCLCLFFVLYLDLEQITK